MINATCILLKNEVPAVKLKEIQRNLEEGEGKILEILKVVDDQMGEDGQEYLVKWKNAEELLEAVSSFHLYKVIKDYWKRKTRNKRRRNQERRKRKCTQAMCATLKTLGSLLYLFDPTLDLLQVNSQSPSSQPLVSSKSTFCESK